MGGGRLRPSVAESVTPPMNKNGAFFLLLALALSLLREVRTAAPPPSNPAEAAGVKWPARRAQLEREWIKMLGPFPGTKPPLCMAK